MSVIGSDHGSRQAAGTPWGRYSRIQRSSVSLARRACTGIPRDANIASASPRRLRALARSPGAAGVSSMLPYQSRATGWPPDREACRLGESLPHGALRRLTSCARTPRQYQRGALRKTAVAYSRSCVTAYCLLMVYAGQFQVRAPRRPRTLSLIQGLFSPAIDKCCD